MTVPCASPTPILTPVLEDVWVFDAGDDVREKSNCLSETLQINSPDESEQVPAAGDWAKANWLSKVAIAEPATNTTSNRPRKNFEYRSGILQFYPEVKCEATLLLRRQIALPVFTRQLAL